jgi:hypothetical protein
MEHVLVSGVFVILLVCLFLVCGDQREKTTREKAWDMIKVIAGFFIGNLTNLIK